MRRLLWCIAAVLGGGSLGAQETTALRDSVQREMLALARATGIDSTRLPALSSVRFGEQTIASGDRVTGPLAVARGTLHIRGEVVGDVLMLGGDVVLESGGRVTGDVLLWRGALRQSGGALGGAALTLDGVLRRGAAVLPASRRLGVALGALAVSLVVGFGVLVFAQRPLDAVAETLSTSFGRSLAAGVIGQVAIIPALLALLIALTLSVLGILLIPFAVVAYALAVAGLCTLGLLAVARMTGRGLRRGAADASPRAQRLAALQGVLLGIVILGLPWVIAAGLAFWPQLGLIAIVLAFAFTWVAITAGFGATLLTRAGTRTVVAPSAPTVAAAGVSWQTPTPVSGVVAARRPTPLSTPRP